MLLCTWISNCPIAVTHFLHNQENVPFVSLKWHEPHFKYLNVLSKISHLQRNKNRVYSCFWMHLWPTPAADSTDLRELGGRWAAGAGSVRAASRHLHLLQRQLTGKLHQVGINSIKHTRCIFTGPDLTVSAVPQNSVLSSSQCRLCRPQREAEAADWEEDREGKLCGEAGFHH